jgi:hypothetical protein
MVEVGVLTLESLQVPVALRVGQVMAMTLMAQYLYHAQQIHIIANG